MPNLGELTSWLGVSRQHRAVPLIGRFVTGAFVVRVHGDRRMARDAGVEESTLFFESAMALRPPRRMELDVVFVPLFTAPKRFPTGRCCLARRDVNSGMCHRRDGRRTTLYVYRTHEIRKVYFHELLHASGLYQDEGADSFPRADFSRVLSEHPWLRAARPAGGWKMVEAVTEALACALELLCRSATASEYAALCRLDALHSASVADQFLWWGDACWDGGRGSVPDVQTPAFEYYVLKDLLYPWALRVAVSPEGRTRESASPPMTRIPGAQTARGSS